MYGDPYFTFHAAGSAATNTSGLHVFFGAYSGLSLLNNSEVIHIQVSPSVNEFRIAPSGTLQRDIGYKMYSGLSTVDLPPMRVGNASVLEVMRVNGTDAPSAFNASYGWVVWRRAPL